MRRLLFFVFACGVFISQPAVVRAEEGGTLLKGGVQMDDVETEAKLSGEDSRHDGKMTALDSKARNLEEAHESELEALEEQENLEGDAKSRIAADKNAWHEKKMNDIDREREIEEKIHAKRIGEILEAGKKLLSKAASAASDAFQSGDERSQGTSPSDAAPNPMAGMGEAPSSNEGASAEAPPSSPADQLSGSPSAEGSPANPLKGNVSYSPDPPSGDQRQRQQAQRQQQEQQQKARALDDAKKKELEQVKKQEAEKKRRQQRQQAQQQQAQRQRQAEAQRQERQSSAMQRSEEEGEGVPSEVRERWSDESIPGRMMKLAHELDRVANDFQNNAMEASNQFCGGMADSLSKSAKILGQKPGTVLPQMIDDLVTYLNNDYNENNQMMYDDAVKAVDEMQKNPARFFGEHAFDMAASAAGTGVELGAVRKMGQARKVGRLAPPRRSSPPPPPRRPSYRPPERSTPSPSQPSAVPPPRQSPPPPLRPSPPPPARPSSVPSRPSVEPPRRPSPARPTPDKTRPLQLPSVRPTPASSPSRPSATPPARPSVGGQRQQQQQAKALEQAGQTLKAMANDAREFSSFELIDSAAKGPVNISKALDAAKQWKTGMGSSASNFVYGDLGTGNISITKVLKQDFGSGKAKNPHHEGLQGLKSHEEGVPLASSQKKIKDALHHAGKDSQGLVFVDGGKGTPGYVFNVRNNNGKIEFWDFQADPPVQLSFKAGKWKRVFFYRLY